MSGFNHLYRAYADKLLELGAIVDVGEWHAQKVDNPLLVTRELANEVFTYHIPQLVLDLGMDVQPNIAFAEAQFQDRVSGEPLNPPPSSALWPYAQRGHEDHLEEGKFSHTYPERFWPKEAAYHDYWGIRYRWGDLADVVAQLVRNPYTRQAYLPVFFPEDTGNVSNVRVPCTLGYHFLFREGKLNITYFIRSVDFVRHFRDDVYMACRLCQWVLDEIVSNKMGNHHLWEQVDPGTLTMHIVSLHCMEGDLPKLRRELNA